MLRLDPGEGRVRTAREFKAWEGGGEYNVARGLRRCFGLRTAVCTAFADNDVGRLLEAEPEFGAQAGEEKKFEVVAGFAGEEAEVGLADFVRVAAGFAGVAGVAEAAENFFERDGKFADGDGFAFEFKFEIVEDAGSGMPEHFRIKQSVDLADDFD